MKGASENGASEEDATADESFGWRSPANQHVAANITGRYRQEVKAIRVRVENGRITGDAPPGLPEGEIDLCLADPEDEMSDEELARLNEALACGFESIKAGRFRQAIDVIAGLPRR